MRFSLLFIITSLFRSHAFVPTRSSTRLNLILRESNDGGGDDEFTKEFFDQVRKRGMEAPSNELNEQSETEKEPTTKFTGKIPPSPEPPSFGQSSLFSETKANVEMERQREFDLASLFQQTLPFQVGFVALALAFVLYVGTHARYQ